MMLDIHRRVAQLRECSKVERAHTLPHHGSYTNGQHSFDMLTLGWALKPDISRDLMLAIMFHDFPERWTGDMPGPVKDDDTQFAKRMAEIEARISRRMGWKIKLTEEELIWCKALDKLELLLWCWDESMMGNRNTAPLIAKIRKWFTENRVPQEVTDFMRTWSWQRTSDSIPK
jgi:5'-deoxynucleotidase YfbR-like HD superfamily hydrolase